MDHHHSNPSQAAHAAVPASTSTNTGAAHHRQHHHPVSAPDSYPEPNIGGCRRKVEIPVLQSDGDNQRIVPVRVMVVPNHEQYALVKHPYKHSKELGVRGQLMYCMVLKRVQQQQQTSQQQQQQQQSSAATAPHYYYYYIETSTVVIVKKLKRWMIDPPLRNGTTQEDPYREIAAHQLCGDDVHVVQFHDVFMDERYLFLVMRDLEALDLRESYLQQRLQGSVEYRQLARQLLENCRHLEQYGIIHRDISVENVLWSTRHQTAPLIDLAMSTKCAPRQLEEEEEGNGSLFQLVSPQPWCGKRPYTSPESIQRDPRTRTYTHPLGCGVDVWSMGVTLLAIATGHLLWDVPNRNDSNYSIFILMGALRNPETLDSMLEYAMETQASNLAAAALVEETSSRTSTITAQERLIQEEEQQQLQRDAALVTKLQAVQQMDPDLRDVIGQMLTEDPFARPTATQLLEQHPWFAATAAAAAGTGPIQQEQEHQQEEQFHHHSMAQ